MNLYGTNRFPVLNRFLSLAIIIYFFFGGFRKFGEKTRGSVQHGVNRFIPFVRLSQELILHIRLHTVSEKVLFFRIMSEIPNFVPTEKQKRQHVRKKLKKRRMDNDRLTFLKVRGLQ